MVLQGGQVWDMSTIYTYHIKWKSAKKYPAKSNGKKILHITMTRKSKDMYKDDVSQSDLDLEVWGIWTHTYWRPEHQVHVVHILINQENPINGY